MATPNRDLRLTFLGTFLMMVAGISLLAIPIHAAFALIQPPTHSGGWARVYLLPVLYLVVGVAAAWGSVVIRRRIMRAEAERRAAAK